MGTPSTAEPSEETSRAEEVAPGRLDRGPYGGHPADTEPGHREDCRRLGAVGQYVVDVEGRDVDEELAARIARAVTGHVRGLPPCARPMELDGPGLEL